MADLTITLLNNVLRELRRDQIASGTNDITDNEYHLLLLGYLNTAKEEVEESWDWEQLYATATVTQSAASTVDISLVATGQSDIDVINRARLLYENARVTTLLRSTKNRFPMVFDVTDTTEERLIETSVAHIKRLRATDNDETGDPEYFAIRDAADGYKELMIWPTPTSVRTFQITFVNPQVELSNNAISTDTLSVPSRPVWLKALWYANQERGDAMGREGSLLWKQQDDALCNAIGEQMTDEDSTAYLE